METGLQVEGVEAETLAGRLLHWSVDRVTECGPVWRQWAWREVGYVSWALETEGDTGQQDSSNWDGAQGCGWDTGGLCRKGGTQVRGRGSLVWDALHQRRPVDPMGVANRAAGSRV